MGFGVSVASMSTVPALPIGTFYINLPDPVLYSNPGWGIVGTGMAFISDTEIAIADGEGKASDAVNTDPRLWSVSFCTWNPYANTLVPARWANGSDIMAGLFEDGTSPTWGSGATAVDSTDYGLQGLSYIEATGRLQLTLINTQVANVTWVIQINPTTGARTAQIRLATSINHMESLNDGALSPARSIAIASAAMTLRRNDTGASVGTGKTHGITSVDMGDFDVARGLLHISSGSNNANGTITTWDLDTSNASLTGAALGTYTDTATIAIEAIRSRPDAYYRIEDPKYHGAGGGTVPNRMIVTRPNPLLALYP